MTLDAAVLLYDQEAGALKLAAKLSLETDTRWGVATLRDLDGLMLAVVEDDDITDDDNDYTATGDLGTNMTGGAMAGCGIGIALQPEAAPFGCLVGGIAGGATAAVATLEDEERAKEQEAAATAAAEAAAKEKDVILDEGDAMSPPDDEAPGEEEETEGGEEDATGTCDPDLIAQLLAR